MPGSANGVRMYAIATTLPSAGENTALAISPASASPALSLLPAARRSGRIDFEAPQHPMNLRAAAYSLDDFLAQIAAFAEADGLQLRSFLHQVALGDLFAIARPPVFDANRARFLGSSFRRLRQRPAPRSDPLSSPRFRKMKKPPAPVEFTRATIMLLHARVA